MMSHLTAAVLAILSCAIAPCSRAADSAGALPTLRAIDDIVTILGRETTEQSLQNLDRIGLYYWPPLSARYSGMPGAIPVDPVADQLTVTSILANRRFLKVLGELSGMPIDQRSSLVTALAANALPAYRTRFSAEMDSFARSAREYFARTGRNLERGFESADDTRVPPGPPPVEALRNQLLVVAILIGNLELNGTQPLLRGLINTALAQRDLLYADTSLGPDCRRAFLFHWSCYNRIALATGLIGVQGDAAQAEARCRAVGVELVQTRLTTWDARATQFDAEAVSNAYGIVADFSKGESLVRYAMVRDDTQFDALLRALGYADHEANTESEPPAGASGVPAVQP